MLIIFQSFKQIKIKQSLSISKLKYEQITSWIDYSLKQCCFKSQYMEYRIDCIPFLLLLNFFQNTNKQNYFLLFFEIILFLVQDYNFQQIFSLFQKRNNLKSFLIYIHNLCFSKFYFQPKSLFLLCVLRAQMSQGVLRLVINQLQSKQFANKPFTLKISAADCCYTISAANIQKKQPRFLPCSECIQFSIFLNEQTDTRFGYFNLPLKALYSYPRKNNKVKLQFVWKEKQDNSIAQGLSATVQLSLVYLDKAGICVQIELLKAILQRDTQKIGQMDPYVQFTLGQVQMKTTVKQQGGKKPVWNEKFVLNFDKIPGRLKFIVKDKDIVYDDVVGQAQLNPHQEGLFKLSILPPQQRQFPLFYSGKNIGRLFTKVNFRIIDENIQQKSSVKVETKQKSNHAIKQQQTQSLKQEKNSEKKQSQLEHGVLNLKEKVQNITSNEVKETKLQVRNQVNIGEKNNNQQKKISQQKLSQNSSLQIPISKPQQTKQKIDDHQNNQQNQEIQGKNINNQQIQSNNKQSKLEYPQKTQQKIAN